MNILLWVLQILGALLYISSGVMKTFLFDKVSKDVPSFGAMPRNVWALLGLLEIICAAALILPDALHRMPMLTVYAAALLAAESLIFIWVHTKYKETQTIAMSAVLGLLMLFVAYGRCCLLPIT